MSLKRRIFSFFAAAVMVFGSMPMTFLSAYADGEQGIVPEEGNIPKSLKSVTSNNDGTYDIKLEIQGVSKQKNDATKANVVVVLDSSGSMDDEETTYTYSVSSSGRYRFVNSDYVQLYRRNSWGNCVRMDNDNSTTRVYTSYDNCRSNNAYTGTRYTRTEKTGTRLEAAQDAVNVLANELLSQNDPTNPDFRDVVEMAFIDFDTTVNAGTTHVDNEVTTNLNTFKSWVSAVRSGGGTNWEAALNAANSVDFGDNDKTYIIFVSDGNPTFRDSKYNSSATDNCYRDGWDYICDVVWGTGTNDNNGWNLGAAQDVADDILDDDNKEFYTIGAFGEASNMESLGGTYYNATDQEGLEAAFADIVDKITMGLSVADLQIVDGITTATSAEIKGTAGNFRYEVPHTDTNDWGQPGVGFSEATFANGAVTWNPNITDDEGNIIHRTLSNGETASVTFTVWPSQEAMDCIAAIRNDGSCSESDLAAFGLGLKNDGSFMLITNSVATFRFKTATKNEETGEITYSEISVPISFTEKRDNTDLPETTLDITKLWLDGLDPDQRDDIKGVAVDFYVDRKTNPDPVRHYTFSKADEHGNEWTGRDQNGKTEYTVAPGVMKRLDNLSAAEAASLRAVANESGGGVVTVNGVEYAVLEKGRDYEFDNESYTFTEEEKDHYYITKRVYHPMIVDDGDIHDVVFLGNNQATIESAPLATLSLENTLKGGIMVSKVVKNNGVVDEDIEDEYEITIYDIKDKDGNLLSHTEEEPRLYRVLTCSEVEEDGEMVENCTGPKKEYYNGTITEKIKVNQRIMVTDVPTGVTYKVKETRPNGYGEPSIKYQVVKYKSNGSSETIKDDNTVYGNASSQAIVTNTLSSGDLMIKKTVTASSGNLTEARKKKFGFTIYFYENEGDANPVRVDDSTCNLTEDEDGNTIDNRIKHDGTCTIKDIPTGWTYKIVEDAVPGFNNGQTTTKTGEIEEGNNNNNVEFKNDYAVSKLNDKDAKIIANKAFASGYEKFWIRSDEFIFVMTGNGESQTSDPLTLDGKTAEFIANITDEGTYTYTITEKTVDENGNSLFRDGVSRLNDDADIVVTLEVRDKGDGTLELVSKEYSKASKTIYNKYEGTNTYGGAEGELEFTKNLTGRNWKSTDEFNFTISSQDEDAPLPKVTTITADKDHKTVGFGKITFTNKDVGNTYTYTVTEDFDVPSVEAVGTTAGGITLTVEVSFNTETGKIDLTVPKYADTFTNEYKTTSVSASKVWDDGNDRDALRKNYKDYYVAVKNGEDEYVAYEKLKQENSDYSFSNLPLKDADGEEIKYEIVEASTCSGSGDAITCKEFTGDNDYTRTIKDGVITNKHEPKLYHDDGELTVQKIWAGEGNESVRPDMIGIELWGEVKNDEGETKTWRVGDPVTISSANEWKWTFKNLYLNENGKTISYSVQETSLGKTAFGKDESTIVVYKEDGETLDGKWVKSINNKDFEVTNTWTPASNSIVYNGKDEFTIKKVDQDRKPLSGVTFKIGSDKETTDKNGEITIEVPITTTDKDGKNAKINENFEYVISEHEARDGYDLVEGSSTVAITCTSILSADSTTLVNNYTKSCMYEKTDDNDKYAWDGTDLILTVINKRSMAKSLTIIKTFSGVNVGVLKDVTFTVEGPEDFGDGGVMTLTVGEDCISTEEKIVCKVDADIPTGKYTVTESNADIEHFTLTVSGDNGEGKTVSKNDVVEFKIKNKYVVDKTYYRVVKVWEDEHDKDGVRPEQLKVELSANGEVIKTKNLSADDETEDEWGEDLEKSDVWECTFEELPVADKNAEVIEYYAEESLETEDYEQVDEISGMHTTIFVNAHEPVVDPCEEGGCGGEVPIITPPDTGMFTGTRSGAKADGTANIVGVAMTIALISLSMLGLGIGKLAYRGKIDKKA